MSRQMVAVFFPASDALHLSYIPNAYDRFMPTDCHAAVWPFAWSTLFPLCLMGVMCGLWGYRRVHQTSYKKSFLYFAGMNTSAAICHCLTPLSSPFKPLMVALDVGFTSAASICLCLGALTSGERDVSKQKLYNRLSCWTPPAALAVAVLGNHVGPLHAVTGLRSIPFLNEVLYIKITLLAAFLMFRREVLQPGLTPQQRKAIVASAASFLPVPLLMGINPWLCKLPVHFEMAHLLFIGCNLSFWFLGKYLILLQHAGASKARKQN